MKVVNRVKLPIDAQKLENAIADKGYTKRYAGEAIGHGSTYINHKMADGFVWSTDASLIEYYLEIPYEVYKAEPVVEIEPVYQQMSLNLDSDPMPSIPDAECEIHTNAAQLYHAVYSAVFNALEDALKGAFNDK